MSLLRLYGPVAFKARIKYLLTHHFASDSNPIAARNIYILHVPVVKLKYDFALLWLWFIHFVFVFFLYVLVKFGGNKDIYVCIACIMTMRLRDDGEHS